MSEGQLKKINADVQKRKEELERCQTLDKTSDACGKCVFTAGRAG